MLHSRCSTILVLNIFVGPVLLAAEVDTEAPLGVPGSCQSLTDDCLEGYTSLLQVSLDTSKVAAVSGHATAPMLLSDKYVWIFGIGIACVCAILFYLTCLRPALATNEGTPKSLEAFRSLVTNPDDVEDDQHLIHDCMEEDTYSFAIAMLVRDVRSLELGDGKRSLKVARIVYAVGLVLLTVGLTVGLLICTKQFVTPMQVADIRDAYSNFEKVMYNNHTYLNANGKVRGIPGFFNASLFDTLTDDQRDAACNIPFSQFPFLCLILLVWSITCFASMKKCFGLFLSLIVFAPCTNSMKSSLTFWQLADAQEEEEKSHVVERAESVHIQVITGLTMTMKVFLCLLVFLPEFGTTAYLLWLGSRWLTATNDFGNIVCNAVALEFILQVKSLVYVAMVSERNKRELNFTGVMPPWSHESAGYGVYFNTLCWLLVSAVWVYLYVMHFQQVLPDYKWDVHQVCSSFLTNILKNSGGGDGD